MRTACFTSFTCSYLPRARILARTLRRHHPDWALHALITDRLPDDLPADALAPFDAVTMADALGIAGFDAWIFGHDLVEAATAVKGAMLARLLAAEGIERVVYLDPDIAVFAPLDPVLPGADASIVLTPHQTAPETAREAIIDNERAALRYGVYNLGFIGVAADTTGRAFAAWWAARLHEACIDAPERGLFTDQRHIDLVPALFDRVRIARDPGCNVASWNLTHRHLAFAPDGRPTVNGAPLRFYHFTKIGGAGDAMTERYAGGNIEVHELVAWYRRTLAAEAAAVPAEHRWAYGAFADGTPIPRGARRLWRADAALRGRFADPFAADFRAWLRVAHPDLFPPEETA